MPDDDDANDVEEHDEQEEGGSGDEKPGDEDTKEKPDKDDNLRAKYWEVVHAAQKEIKRKNPEMSNRDVLKLARESCLDNISLT